jgi:serine/threonine-protein kinase
MELLEGSTLREVLDRIDGPIEPATVARWFRPIFTAVGAAHGAGVVHRDLKPENVFMTTAGVIKVLDFGLARFVQAGEGSSVTTPGLLVGTLGYIAPEQFLGKDADEQSDVFSLGVMLFEALTGELPYLGESLAHLATSVFIDDPHLAGEEPAVVALDKILSRSLTHDRKRRFTTVKELAEAVLPALAACPILVKRAETP